MTAPRLIGIFGTGRNGSTLLTRLLDGIDGVYVHPVESNFLCAMNDLALLPVVRRRTIQNAVDAPLRRLHRRIPMRRLMSFYDQHCREIEQDYIPLVAPIELGEPARERVRVRSDCTPAEFVPFFLGAIAQWVEKDRPAGAAMFKSIETPYIGDYERLFPDMRFIHIIRDPVEVWASSKRSLVSYKKLPPWYLGSDNLRTTIDRRWLPHARAILARRGAPNHFTVRYEDLVKDPGDTIRGICDWLGVAPPEAPDTQTMLGGRHPRAMPDNPSQRGVATPRRAVADLHERHAFEEVVTPRERDLIVHLAYPLARELGYFETLSPPDPRQLWRAWRSVDEWDFRHVAGGFARCKALASLIRRRAYVWRCCQESSYQK